MFAVYRAYFMAALNVQLQYRVAALIWMIGTVLQPTVSLVVWQTVAGTNSVHGYTASDFAAYFLLMMIANHVTFTWVMWDYEFHIKSGQLATRLLKPVHPIHQQVADNVTHKLLTLVVVIPAFGALAALFHPVFHASAWQLIASLPALFLGAVMRYLIEYILAMAAFYTTRVTALNQLYDSLLFLLSGQLAPLALMPGPVQAAATLLPFRSMVAFPVELALGRLRWSLVVQGFALQLFWLVVAYAGFRAVWRLGVRAFTAVGA